MSIDFNLDELGIATIVINRPDRRNALDAEHYAALSEAWIRVRDDDAIRCAIVTGAGDLAFCAGADLRSWIGRRVELAELWRTQQGLLLNRGLEVWKPVIAAVNGACVGGGMTLLQATDLRVAVPHARFGLPEVTRGTIPSNGGVQRLLGQLPHAVAMRMLLTGEAINAEEACRWGLVNNVVPLEQLIPAARSYAERIASNAPLAVQAAKEMMLRSRDMSMADSLRMAQLASRILQGSEDVKEGRAAFQEKRRARFQGK